MNFHLSGQMASVYAIGALLGYSAYKLALASDMVSKKVGDRSDGSNTPARVIPSTYGQSLRREVDQRVRVAKEMMGPNNQIRYFSRHPAAPQ